MQYLKIGNLVPATVIKALPEHRSYLMAIADTELMALLPKEHAGSQLRIGNNTIVSVYSIEKSRIYLSQTSALFYRRLTEMLISPLLIEEKVKVVRAAAIPGAGFAKVAVAGLNGCNPIAECLPYIKTAVRQYTDTSITIVRYSSDKMEYVANAFAPAPRKELLEVIPFQDNSQIHVRVRPSQTGLFMGKGGANVATVSKLLGVRVYVQPAW